MVIQGMATFAAQQVRVGAQGVQRDRAPRPVAKPESGPQSVADQERAKLLESIKNRITRGFYNSDAVLDDLSDSFATVLNEVT